MPGTIALLRHGDCIGGPRYRGRTDDLLTPQGRARMRTAVANRSWDHIVSSPLRRCADLARELAMEHALPLAIDARWRELDFGAWDGKTAAELFSKDARALERFWAEPDVHTPPRGEPLRHFERRVVAAWNDLVMHGVSRRVLVITHGGPIRVLITRLDQRPLRELLQVNVPMASLTEIDAARMRQLDTEPMRC